MSVRKKKPEVRKTNKGRPTGVRGKTVGERVQDPTNQQIGGKKQNEKEK